MAFVWLWLFTLLLYVRPGELFPSVLGAIPFAKAVGVLMLLCYLGPRIRQQLPFSIWPIELQCVLIIAVLGLALAPIAFSREVAFGALLDVYLKVICAFIVLINVVHTRQRLERLLLLMVLCGAVLAVLAMQTYVQGEFTLAGVRIEGAVGGSLQDPNDLAMNFDILFPIAVVLALSRQGWARVVLWLSALALAGGTVATLSRGGFLGLLVAFFALLWTLGRRHLLSTFLVFSLAGGLFLAFGPDGYGSRLATIVRTDHGGDASIAARLASLDRGWYLATHHLVFGIGMGNFLLYANDDHVAHNSYLETSSELGLAGLLAYVALIAIPIQRMSRICRVGSSSDGEFRLLAVGLRASLLAYATCAMFLSIEYTWAFYLIAGCAVALSLHMSGSGSAKLSASLSPPLLVTPRSERPRAGFVRRDQRAVPWQRP